MHRKSIIAVNYARDQLYIYLMNSSSITYDKLPKDNKTKNDKAADSIRVEVKDEFENAEAFGNPDAYHK